MDIGERIRAARGHAGLSKAELARRVGVSHTAVAQWEDGGTKDIKSANLFAIAEATAVSAAWLQFGGPEPWGNNIAEQTALYNTSRCIPIVGTAQAGPDGYWQDEDYPPGAGNGFIRVPTNNPNTYALRIKGDSNAPAVRNGWIVIIEPGGNIHPGEFTLVCTADGQCMIKEFLYRRNGEYTLGSINADYTQITLDEGAITRLEPVVLIAPPSRAMI